MNIKQLKYFISVANHLSFTKASKEHYLSQTAISQQIKNLEDSLGFKLFFRTKTSVSLTPSGSIFYNEAKAIIDNLNKAINKASLASSNYNAALTIGFLEGHEKIFLPKLLSKFRENYPNIKLNIIRGTIDNLYEKLQTGTLDLVFSFNFGNFECINIQSKTIRTYPISAVLYKEHPFASRNLINRIELRNENFIFINRNISPFSFNNILSDFIVCGFFPNIIHEVDSLETLLLLIESNIGITVLPNLHYDSNYKNLVFVNLEGETAKSTISWNTKNITPEVQTFLNFTDEILNDNSCSYPLSEDYC